MVSEMSLVGPQAMKGSYNPLVKKMLEDCRIADRPKLHTQQQVSRQEIVVSDIKERRLKEQSVSDV